MKRLLFLAVLVILTLPLLALNVEMKNGTIYYGYYEAKQDSNIYIVDWRTVYVLPVVDVVKIMKGYSDVTEDCLTREDFRNIDITSRKYQLVSYNELIKALPKTREEILKMSDREFAIYQMAQQKKQSEELKKQVKGVSSTMWTIWGLSISLSILTSFIINAQ